MLTFSCIGIALLGLVFTVDGQTVAPDPRCDAFGDGIGNIMVEGMNCKYYLSCWDFIIDHEPLHCAGGTIFNPDTGMCDAEECNEGNRQSQYVCREGALPSDCSRYNLCFNTPNVTFQCGEQTYYHNEMLVCVNPSEYPDLPEEQGCDYNP